MSQREAYIQAGYSKEQAPATLDRHASEVASKDKVLARLEELKKAAEGASVATVLERKQVLTEIVRGRFADFMTNLTKEKLRSAALQELRITESEGVKSTVIKLHNPIQAINELNKMEKIYSEGATVNVDNRSITITVQSEKAKELTERIVEGQGTGD